VGQLASGVGDKSFVSSGDQSIGNQYPSTSAATFFSSGFVGSITHTSWSVALRAVLRHATRVWSLDQTGPPFWSSPSVSSVASPARKSKRKICDASLPPASRLKRNQRESVPNEASETGSEKKVSCFRAAMGSAT
jgi:hypothetical protein